MRDARAQEGTSNAQVLALLKGRMKTRGMDSEIELTDQELRAVQTAGRRWQHGGEKAFGAILRAADRHR